MKGSTKKWIAVISLVLLSAANITAPINLRQMIPANLLGYISWVSIAGLVAAYWVMNKETD